MEAYKVSYVIDGGFNYWVVVVVELG